MNTVFLISLSFIFFGAIVGIYVRRRSRDRCLKDFGRSHVTIEREDGRRLWGSAAVFPNGVELFYKQPSIDKEGHQETSSVLFSDDLGKIRVVYRYHDELTAENQERRLREISRTYHPGLWRRSGRAFRNFLNVFRDAFNQSIGVLAAQAKKGGGGVLKAQDKQIKAVGEKVLGAVANAYEPIIERYIGRRVVLEEVPAESLGLARRIEHPGILKEYTKDWFELLDCHVVEEREVNLSQPEPIELNRDLDVVIRTRPALSVRLENHGDQPVFILGLSSGDWERPLDEKLASGASVEIALDDLPDSAFDGVELAALPEEIGLRAESRSGSRDGATLSVPPLPDVSLRLRVVREADLCLPRRTTRLSHGGEPIRLWYRRRS